MSQRPVHNVTPSRDTKNTPHTHFTPTSNTQLSLPRSLNNNKLQNITPPPTPHENENTPSLEKYNRKLRAFVSLTGRLPSVADKLKLGFCPAPSPDFSSSSRSISASLP